jgi:hypothetical protein
LLQVDSDRGLLFRILRTAQLAWIGDLAAASLLLEAETWPKPGLVSHLTAAATATWMREHSVPAPRLCIPFSWHWRVREAPGWTSCAASGSWPNKP